jgi:hypothetical protein
MPDGEVGGGLKEYVLAVLCMAVLVFVAFFGSYAGSNLEPPSPRPLLGNQEQEAISSACKNKCNPKKSETDQTVPVVNPPPTETACNKCSEAKSESDGKPSADWWLVIFTAALAFIGAIQIIVFGYQGIQLGKTVTLGQREFVATHRPRIRIRRIGDIGIKSGHQVTAKIEAANTGETKASVFEIGFDIFINGSAFSAVPIKLGNAIDVITGKQADIAVRGGLPLSQTDINNIFIGAAELCILCIIRYKDDLGIDRQTSVFRIYNAIHRKFMPAPPVHEYAEWDYED